MQLQPSIRDLNRTRLPTARTLRLVVLGSSLLLDVRRPSRGTVALGVGSAVGLGTIDVTYATRGRISKVYLIDAIIELSVVAIWLTYLLPKPLTRRVQRSEK